MESMGLELLSPMHVLAHLANPLQTLTNSRWRDRHNLFAVHHFAACARNNGKTWAIKWLRSSGELIWAVTLTPRHISKNAPV